MKSTTLGRWVFCSLLVLSAAGAGVAGEGDAVIEPVREDEVGPQEPGERLEQALQRRLSLDMDDVPFKVAIERLRSFGRINLVVHQKALQDLEASRITLKLTNVTLWSALEALARSTDLRIRWLEGILYLEPRRGAGGQAGTLRLGGPGMQLEVRLGAEDLDEGVRRGILDHVLERLEQHRDGRHPDEEEDHDMHEERDRPDGEIF